ncbi:MAG: DUF2203 domain-containing protein [Verrucomicrobiota bacterium]
MAHQFEHHYTLAEARALLPQLRLWLEQLADLYRSHQQEDREIARLSAEGRDAGGDVVERWIRTLAFLCSVMAEFQTREIQIKDLERGLIDFPALMDGREVFLCWEKNEDDIEHWHDLDAGFAGREKL